ncbi:MAG: hypothetical protein CMQ61_04165 [Gammaproteobacteria bacterium]|nr:hypothetical protein [Gammaproteobacteria bacterium]
MTGFANRRYLDRARQPIALVMADIDLFKQYNDRYYHPAGDPCLRQFAALLKSACRHSSDIARKPGEGGRPCALCSKSQRPQSRQQRTTRQGFQDTHRRACAAV